MVFDFDGVLADTEGLHLRTFQDVFSDRGWMLDRAAYYDRYLGYDDHDLVSAFANDQRLDVTGDEIGAIVRDKTERFAKYLASDAVLYPTARAAVARLASHYSLAIASGSLNGEITAILTHAGLAASFRAIVGADDVSRRKPAPDPYVEAVARLGVAPAAAVAIEDSRWGLASAHAAGLRTIGITTSYAAPELSPADAIVSSLDEITPELIDRLLT